MATTQTPLMQQYYAIKQEHPQDILLFRVGDFYETFEEDAHKVSELLDIALTKRANGAASHVALAGFPYHALDTYAPKLVAAGLRVAICDQVEDPKEAKGLVKREVTQLLTPGLIPPSSKSYENHFLAALFLQKKEVGLALLDFSTGEFFLHQADMEAIKTYLQTYKPAECLFSTLQRTKIESLGLVQCPTHAQADWIYTPSTTEERLLRHFGLQTMKAFGVDALPIAQVAACGILQYLADTQHTQAAHIVRLQPLEDRAYMWMDGFTIRNLELVQPLFAGAKTLFDTLNITKMPMGARCLRRWLLHPLKQRTPIEERQSIVGHFVQNPSIAYASAEQLGTIGDFSRLIGRLAIRRITPKELLKIAQNLHAAQQVMAGLSGDAPPALQVIVQGMDPCTVLTEKIFYTLHNDPAASPTQGTILNPTAYPDVKELTTFINDQRKALLDIQIQEAQNTGITSLKIGYNKIFGFYLEVRNTHKSRVPEGWIRKQTLVGAERYITLELKEYEERIITAEQKLASLQEMLYSELITEVLDHVMTLRTNADLLAELDVLLAFGILAIERSYTAPIMVDEEVFAIEQGRHPVIEANLPQNKPYVPNDVQLNTQDKVLIITGPNMSGKSALLRMSALVVIMAQVGCFVPAKAATIGLVNKLFTRVGASDNLTQGESTFMIEMTEAASILHGLSGRCLVLMDEIGRGTSTYDGISIAWAIVEQVQRTQGAYMLFATHYHELSLLTSVLAGVRNFHVSVREEEDKVVFLYRLKAGSTQHSFGLHVAKMAGVPTAVVQRAYEVLQWLEATHNRKSLQQQLKKNLTDKQTGLFKP